MLDREGHVVTVVTLLDESGYTKCGSRTIRPRHREGWRNLKELVRALADFETLTGFLDHVSLVMENNEALTATGSA